MRQIRRAAATSCEAQRTQRVVAVAKEGGWPGRNTVTPQTIISEQGINLIERRRLEIR